MKKIPRWLKVALLAVALLALVCGSVFLLKASERMSPAKDQAEPGEAPSPPSAISDQRSVPRPPTPTPPGYRPPGYRTDTPDIRTPIWIRTLTPHIFTTATPLPISRTVDLAPELPDEQKTVVIIRRADGTYEKYIISRLTTVDIRTSLGMGPEDVLVINYPLKPGPPPIYRLLTPRPPSQRPWQTP